MKDKSIKVNLLILLLVFLFTPNCLFAYDLRNKSIIEINNIIYNFQPYKIGNPLGNSQNNLINKRYFNKSTHWWYACIFSGVSIIFLFGIKIYQALRLHKAIIKSKCHKNLSQFIISLICGIIGYGIGCGLEAYYGGPFDYAAYSVPEEPVDIVFWFSGADEGACGHKDFGTSCDYCYAATEFGYEHVAMFNFSDVDDALKYARKLPDGTRLIVRGHSTGASSAIRFVHQLPAHIKVLLLDTRDPISWLGRNKEKPSNVLYWRNVLPGDAHVIGKKDQHKGTKFIGPINCANLDMVIGGPWGICHGATNIILPGKDHHEVGRNIDK